MSEVIELKPCPFCGSNSFVFTGKQEDYATNVDWTVYCNVCGTVGPNESTEQEAIDKWNTRQECK